MDLSSDPPLSDLILPAAGAVLPPDVVQHFKDPAFLGRLAVKQRPLVPLLIGLLDSARVLASAIADNAWDDSCPLESELAEGLANQAYRLGADITNAAQCPDHTTWSLPSMTGKELV